MGTTLPLFWNLSSANKKERLDASVKLVGALEQFQEQFVPRQDRDVQSHSDEDDDEENTQKAKDDGLDALNAQDVSYSIRRLIRGLASPRESSRLGFAVALTELLSRINTVTCTQIVTLITDSSKTQGSMTGQEERDVLFARLFGLMCVIQSGLLVRKDPLPASASSAAEVSTLSSYTTVLSQLIALGEKKSWLRESAWCAILSAIDVLHGSDVVWRADAVESTIQLIFVDYKIWSPEKIALALKLQSFYPKKGWSKLFAPTFKNGDLLSSTNLQTLARILKESDVEDSERESIKSGGGSWRPQLHFAWNYLLDQFLPESSSGNAPRGSFQDFFRVVVDESLFSSTSSPQRKYWGFQVFQKALHRVDEERISMLFTKNFMRSWINHLSNRDRCLHKIAQQTAAEVQAFVQKNPQLGFSLILQLTGVHGSQQFDKLTKTKTVESILTSTDVAGIEKYIRWLFSQVDDPDAVDVDAIRAVNTRRQWIIDQLGALIHNGGVPKNGEWVQSILDWLVVRGIFLVRKIPKGSIDAVHSIPKPPFSDELRKGCRTRLLGCLSDLNVHTTILTTGNKTSKASALASDGEFWVSRVLSTIAKLEADRKHVSLLVQVDEEGQELRNSAREIAKRLKVITGDKHEAARGVELLLTATAIQHYCAHDEDDMNNDALQACIDGAVRMFPEDKKGKKQSKTKNKGEEETHDPIDDLVDTVIGFLESATAYLKTNANQVFALLSGSVKESTIDLILTQLERRDPTTGEGEEDEDTVMEEEKDEDGNSDEESEESEESDGSSEEINTEDEDEDINDEETLKLRNKIEEALRVNGIEPATGDTDSEEEELMDDDQMMAIDEQLAQVFRSRANEKKSGKDNAQREATHFKNRVLDLVEIFIKKQPSNPFVLRFIIPLVDLITGAGPDERQLSDKAKGILRSRIAKLKEIPSTVTKDDAAAVLKEIHSHSRRVHTPDLLPTLSQCSLYLSRILLHLEAQDAVVEMYRKSLTDFLTRKNSAFNTNYFQDFLHRHAPIAWALRNDLLQLSDKAINGYRQSQAIHLLENLINHISSSNDHKDELIAFMPSLNEGLHNIASSACHDQATLTAAQLKEVMKLVLIALRKTQRLAPEQLHEIWESEPWTTLKSDFANCPRLKASVNLQKMCEQVNNALRATGSEPSTKLKKRKASESEPPQEKKKTKRKRVKENLDKN